MIIVGLQLWEVEQEEAAAHLVVAEPVPYNLSTQVVIIGENKKVSLMQVSILALRAHKRLLRKVRLSHSMSQKVAQAL